MTKSQALKALEGPLQFGNQTQIEARKWLYLFEAAKELAVGLHGTGQQEINHFQPYTLPELRALVQEMEEAAYETVSPLG